MLSHDYGRFLPEAIESALAQDHAPLEILVLDDGSTDDSLEIARRYEPRVRVVAQANQGLARACNIGVDEARGEYVVFLSADDCWSRPTSRSYCTLWAGGQRPRSRTAHPAFRR